MEKFVAILIIAVVSVAGLHATSLEEASKLRAAGNLDEAQRAVEEIIAAEPDSAEAQYRLGEILIDRGDLAAAEGAFDRTGELGSEGLARIGKGRILLAQEKMAEAKKAFDEAQTSSACEADLYYYRGLANAALRDYQGSAADFEKSLELQPGNAKAHYYAGLAYNALRRPDKMVAHFQMYLKSAPDGPEAARIRSILRGVR